MAQNTGSGGGAKAAASQQKLLDQQSTLHSQLFDAQAELTKAKARIEEIYGQLAKVNSSLTKAGLRDFRGVACW